MIARRRFAHLFAGLALAPSPLVHAGSPCQPIAPIHPVRDSDDPIAKAFLKGILNDESITLYYLGGSTPGALRRFRPHSLYRLTPGGPIFASGICQYRRATRTLRLDRVRMA
jgi:hypothetical protein